MLCTVVEVGYMVIQGLLQSLQLSASPVQQVTQNSVCSWSVSHSESWQLREKLLC